MLAAVVAFSLMDVSMKRLAETYPAMQVTFIRALASLPFIVLVTAWLGGWRDFRPHRWGLHLLRGVLQVSALYFFVYALSRLSMADAYTIFMSAPLLMTALSVPFFGEKVGWHRWMAIGVGLSGVLIVVRPSDAGVDLEGLNMLGAIAAISAAFAYALGSLLIRVLRSTDSSGATMFWPLLLTAIIAGVAASPTWVPVLWEHWPWIALIGISGGVGQYFFTEAFRLAAPPVIAPLEYTALAWAMAFDWLLWTTVPSSRMLLGAGIIVASGIYVIHRERLQAIAASQES